MSKPAWCLVNTNNDHVLYDAKSNTDIVRVEARRDSETDDPIITVKVDNVLSKSDKKLKKLKKAVKNGEFEGMQSMADILRAIDKILGLKVKTR